MCVHVCGIVFATHIRQNLKSNILVDRNVKIILIRCVVGSLSYQEVPRS